MFAKGLSKHKQIGLKSPQNKSLLCSTQARNNTISSNQSVKQVSHGVGLKNS